MSKKERIIESRDSTALFPPLLGLWVPPLRGGTIPLPFEYLNQKPWDVRWFYKSVCINVPAWRKAIKRGKSEMVDRVENLDMNGLAVANELPDQATQCL